MALIETVNPRTPWLEVDQILLRPVPTTIDTVLTSQPGNNPDQVEPGYTDWVPSSITPAGGARLEVYEADGSLITKETVTVTGVINYVRAITTDTIARVDFTVF